VLSVMEYLGKPEINNLKLTPREKASLELLFAEILAEDPNEETVKVITSYVKACDLHPERAVFVDFSDLNDLIRKLEERGDDAATKSEEEAACPMKGGTGALEALDVFGAQLSEGMRKKLGRRP